MKLAKSDLTVNLEKQIANVTSKMGVFGCFEVTIGFGGDERVDYITYDTKGIWRCYEIKVSKSDFYSKAKKSFVGHFNYFVMPEELYEQVKDDVPKHIGVYLGSMIVKNPKKQELLIDEQILKDSMIRSLYRDAQKLVKSRNTTIVESLEKQLQYTKSELRDYKQKYRDLVLKTRDKLGRGWQDEDEW